MSCRAESLKDLCNKKKKRGQTITIESVKHHAFSSFLRLLYTGRVEVPSKYYKSLTELTAQYRLEYKERKMYGKSKYIFTLPSVSLKSLLNSRAYSDLTFNVSEDNTILYGHKCIVSSRSQYIGELLSNEEEGDSVNSLTIDDVKSKHFKILLTFIYDGLASSGLIYQIGEISEICEILELSSKYRVSDLHLTCQKVLYEKFLTPETVLFLYDLSRRTYSEQLKQCCIYLLKCEVDKVNSTVKGELETIEDEHELMEQLKLNSRKLTVGRSFGSYNCSNFAFIEQQDLSSNKMDIE